MSARRLVSAVQRGSRSGWMSSASSTKPPGDVNVARHQGWRGKHRLVRVVSVVMVGGMVRLGTTGRLVKLSALMLPAVVQFNRYG